MAEEIRLEMDKSYMNVIRFGSGKKVFVVIAGVSLCGLEGFGEGVAASYGMFSDDYTVYVFDRRKELEKGVTIEDFADDVYSCLERLGVSKASVYGVSQGGMIAMELAIKHSDFVEKLALCSTCSRKNDIIDAAIEEWYELAKNHDVVSINKSFFKKVYSPQLMESMKESVEQLYNVGTAEDCDRFCLLLDAMRNLNIYDRLDEIKCPVLAIADEQDKVLGSIGAKEIADKLNCEIYLYDKYSHAVYDEAPDIKSRIKAFID